MLIQTVPPSDRSWRLRHAAGAKFPNLLTVLRLAVALECKVVELVGVFDKTDLRALLK